jgi:energy-coupling factor transporter ATP-binding protein EcfA2
VSETSSSAPDTRGIRLGDVGGDVNFSALGDIVGGDKITTITTTIQISVEAVTQRPLVTASPYRGLDRFEDRDKDLFFGRDQLIKSLLAQLSASNVLLVLGASGSGKSSVVRAGLLPQLSQLMGARFRYFMFVPDVNPFESLRSSLQAAGFSQAQTRELTDARPETLAKLIPTLQRAGEQWLFFVDQFEEIFTQADEKLRANFIAALTQIAEDTNSSTKLVLAMRADFLDRFSPFPRFAKIIEKNIDIVANMHADELRQAIEQPAARHGVVFEQGLVEEIIEDVQGQAGSLPLLQYTLDLLWQEETQIDGLADRHLNTKAYRELGGVRGALQKRANEIYASFGDNADAKTASPKQEIVRQIFLRLVDLAGEDANAAAWRPVRRRASISMFATAREREVLQSLIDQKLLVSNREGDDATVEVAHEALFSSWERLRDWIEAGKQVIFAKNRLADDARRWQHRQEEGDTGADEELITGSRLAQALDMRARGDFLTVVGGLAAFETRFLDASLAQRDRRAQEEDARQQRELEAAKRLAAAQKAAAGRLRIGLAVAIVLLLAVAGLAWSAHQSKQTALAAKQQAETAKGKAVAAQRLAESEKQKAVTAQERTVREMIEASWKAGLYLRDEKANVLRDPKAEQKRIEMVYAATGSSIPGSRWLYAHLKTLMDLQKMKSLAPMPIFLSGPHDKDFTYLSYDFAHYNPEFVRWAADNLIPAASDSAFRKATAPVYEKQLKEVARVYYLAYFDVEKREAEAAATQAKYLDTVRAYREKPYTADDPSDPGEILKAFSDAFANVFPMEANASFGDGRLASAKLTYRWISPDGQYIASAAPSFWIRRRIDGTAPEFFAGLKKLLETYDAAFLKDPAAP